MNPAADDPGWVTRRLGARLVTAPDAARPLDELVQLALRRNPKRAHLLVSRVLGKHVPVDPRELHDRGLELGAAVAAVIGAQPAAVLGYAETATGLGHCVAEALHAGYLHSTRRAVATARDLAGFEEEHSHASSHQLLPEHPDDLLGADVVVLVDDELSTGRTARNTVAALHALAPHPHYVVAALVDLRSADDRAAFVSFADSLGVRLDVVALSAGSIELPDGFAAAAADLVAAAPVPQSRGTSVPPVLQHGGWPAAVADGGRHGITPDGTRAMRTAAAGVAERLAPELGDDVLVLATEELMYAPTLIGVELAERGVPVRLSSTTRSPVLAIDEDGYPIRTAITFGSHDPALDGPGPRFAYNVARPHRWSDVVVVVDTDGDSAALRSGLLTELAGLANHVHLVVVPTRHPLPESLHGPDFGSYAADEVTWLLTDLSDVRLEAPTEEREEAIQSGGAHYAESLPVEYQPDASYLRLFDDALAATAGRIAHAVGVVTELVLAERGGDGRRPVLASLARAGTPVGVLMRRWARFRHDIDLPHHTISIVRGRGIDTVALRWLAEHHDPADVVFVDGWTGKGAITRELDAAVADANRELGVAFDSALAVLADPGGCVTTFGTRDDFLVPSACLNSTVSGLVSRTVLNDRILAPGQFHGAKFYRELADADVSRRFLDAISQRFEAVAGDVDADWPVLQKSDRTPTWAGWAEIERISEQYGIGDVTLVKPGVGETTRVLLRRVPWQVLVRPDAAADLAHVRLLAEQRGVPVVEVEGLTYSCVGLIHPRFTRGATGSDGRAAS
ncbi:phosphoribosyltransferase [Jatrophihabitans fulvus]